jgi:hypothetical protein
MAHDRVVWLYSALRSSGGITWSCVGVRWPVNMARVEGFTLSIEGLCNECMQKGSA